MTPRYVAPMSVVRSSGRPLSEIMPFAETVDGKKMIPSERAEVIISAALGALREALASPPPASTSNNGARIWCLTTRDCLPLHVPEAIEGPAFCTCRC